MQARRTIRLMAFAFASFLFVGCFGVDRKDDNGVSTYSFATWMLSLPILLGAFLAVVGLLTRKGTRAWISYVFLALGPLVALLGVPMMAMDRTVVDDEHFTSSHGLPWAREEFSHRFDEISSIDIDRIITKRQNGPESNSYFLDCKLKNGGNDRMQVGNVMESAVPQILGNAKKKGATIRGWERLPDGVRTEWQRDQ
jgi:hypothetical protein